MLFTIITHTPARQPHPIKYQCPHHSLWLQFINRQMKLWHAELGLHITHLLLKGCDAKMSLGIPWLAQWCVQLGERKGEGCLQLLSSRQDRNNDNCTHPSGCLVCLLKANERYPKVLQIDEGKRKEKKKQNR